PHDDVDDFFLSRVQRGSAFEARFGHRRQVAVETVLNAAVRLHGFMYEKQNALMAKTNEMFSRGVSTRCVIDDDLRQLRIGIISQQYERQPPIAEGISDVGRDCLEYDAAIDLPAQDYFLPS